MPVETIHPTRPRRQVDPAVAARLRQQLNDINWREFNTQVQREVTPLVQAYADARVRSRERMRHKVLR